MRGARFIEAVQWLWLQTASSLLQALHPLASPAQCSKLPGYLARSLLNSDQCWQRNIGDGVVLINSRSGDLFEWLLMADSVLSHLHTKTQRDLKRIYIIAATPAAARHTHSNIPSSTPLPPPLPAPIVPPRSNIRDDLGRSGLQRSISVRHTLAVAYQVPATGCYDGCARWIPGRHIPAQSSFPL